jgi:hypothetical protein
VKHLLTFFPILLLFLWLPAIADAAEGESRRYIRMEEVEIIGVVEHPEITYIIPKTRIRFSRIPLQRSFAVEGTRPMTPHALKEEIEIKRLLSGQPPK